MAGSAQKKTAYASLTLTAPLPVERILSFQTWEAPGEHAKGSFLVLLLPEADVTGFAGESPVLLCESGKPIFGGYAQEMEIRMEQGRRYARIETVSGTMLFDRVQRERVFQKPDQTCVEVAEKVMEDTDHGAFILPGEDEKTGGTLIQYQETDWAFLTRLASRQGLPLVADSSYYYPRFYLGLPEGESRELGEVFSCDLCFDGKYYAVSERCTVERRDFLCYDVVTESRLSMGDRVTVEGRELLVVSRQMKLERGEVVYHYRLAGKSYLTIPRMENPDYTGMSFTGTVTGTKEETGEITLDIDREAGSGNSYGFAPATGNLMYCMPQVGTRTALYLGNAEEADGILTGCIRTNGNTCEGMEKPENKGFLSEHGKGLNLYPESMGLTGKGAGMICLEDEGGAILESEGSLILMAKEGIRLEGMSGIALLGMSGIMALHDGGVSSLCINGSIDLLGGSTGLGACVYQSFPPYDDAPKEGEFDWGGFWRNIAIGVGVGIACIGLSCIPVLGPIASGALLGAGIGALSATVTGAISDYSSGNVRSVKETIRDVSIAALSGAVTGAFGVKFPEASRLAEGVVDTIMGLGGRAIYAAFDGDMPWKEKLAYVFNPGQIAADFITGIVIGEAVDKAGAWIKNKPSTKPPGIKSGTGTKKPYATSRPSYGKGQVEQVWENAKDPITGKVYDPSGVEITWDPTKPRNGQWDMGHIPGEKYSEMHQLYMDDVITKDEFLEWYRNPDNYRPELPSTNRSHKYE
ncbi:MAG: GH-E family nuclease [Lachnospiraceae bacterium]|nr:GH-E family nuclease [Lachnospiraceae bacterium]